jgi:hypothetical protein
MSAFFRGSRPVHRPLGESLPLSLSPRQSDLQMAAASRRCRQRPAVSFGETTAAGDVAAQREVGANLTLR